MNVPIGVNEMVLAIWLIVRGFDLFTVALGARPEELTVVAACGGAYVGDGCRLTLVAPYEAADNRGGARLVKRPGA